MYLGSLDKHCKKTMKYGLSWENINGMFALKIQNFKNYGDLGNRRFIFKCLAWNLNTSFRRNLQNVPFFWCLGI